ncbi:hypothetical protein J2T13_004252 [Paenibacillus sp. DS2015]|uniref:hypothetical protein n=1 Tax=Paenibacillus sp. DS2015 TaxID=3373917 RepID=UPI003D230EC8
MSRIYTAKVYGNHFKMSMTVTCFRHLPLAQLLLGGTYQAGTELFGNKPKSGIT